MQLHQIDNSHISHIGLNGADLYVAFGGGKTYVYPDCNEQMLTDFLNAESKGKHFRTMGLGKHSQVLDSLPACDIIAAEPQQQSLTVIQNDPIETVIATQEPVSEATLEIESLTLYEQATALTIYDQDSFVAAGELGKGLKSLEKKIIDYFEPLRITARANLDAILKKKNDELAPVIEAMAAVRATMNTFAQEQERIRQAEEKRLQTIAEEDARKEREKLERQAEKAIDNNKPERAEELIERRDNIYTAPVTVAPTIDKTVRTSSGNITQAKETKITVVNAMAFCKALAASNPGAFANIIKIGDGPLKAWVKANGIEKFDGLIIEKTVGVRL